MEPTLFGFARGAYTGATNARAGYFEDAAATAAAFTPDGYLRTGDVGVLDAAGNLRITDRIKDMYLVGGFNCYPAEIEQVLLRMPGVRAAAVIGHLGSALPITW